MATSVTSGSKVTPNDPIVNLGNLYVNGLTLTWTSATAISVGAGQCRDSTDTVDIIMGGNQYASTTNVAGEQGVNNPVTASSAVAISTAVVGAGGIDTGAIATSTLYHVHAIGDSRGFNTGSALISTSATAPSLPLGYDCFRRIGSITTYTDSTTKVRPFQQTGAGLLKTMWYDSLSLTATGVGIAIPSSATTASQTLASIGVLTTVIPQTALEVMIYGSLVANAAGDSLWLTPYGFTGPATGFRTNASGTVEGHVMRVPCALNTVEEIYYATSSATATVAFTCPGYVDQL